MIDRPFALRDTPTLAEHYPGVSVYGSAVGYVDFPAQGPTPPIRPTE